MAERDGALVMERVATLERFVREDVARLEGMPDPRALGSYAHEIALEAGTLWHLLEAERQEAERLRAALRRIRQAAGSRDAWPLLGRLAEEALAGPPAEAA
jgi:hypothetical protein